MYNGKVSHEKITKIGAFESKFVIKKLILCSPFIFLLTVYSFVLII